MECNPFDVATKELIRDNPIAWRERFGVVPGRPIKAIDFDI
jgi:hypothetical protein